jgi:PadR family transcriptional regulator PadR
VTETQLLKGVLEGCVLQVIAQKEIYGYELVQELKQRGFETIVGGTIYPLLQKLEKQELITSEMKKSPEGPDRKYFSITPKGIDNLAQFREQWTNLMKKVEGLFKE